jgi:hypothetical protein
MSGLIAALQTGAMIVGATAATAGSISSFSQANKQKKRMQAAEREAKKAMDDARKRIDVNVMEQLSIQKEPYELAREASLVAGTQALQAGVEGSQRGAAATAGRVFMGQQDAQGKIRAAMGQEMGDINRAVVAEEGRLLDIGMGLSLEEVAGAQAAAANAEALRAQAIQQGFEGLTQAASTVYEGAPLYGGGGGDALNPRSMGANKNMLTRRQRAPYLEAMEAYDASQRILGQPVLQQSQFTPPSQLDLYQQGVVGRPNLFSSFGGK